MWISGYSSSPAEKSNSPDFWFRENRFRCFQPLELLVTVGFPTEPIFPEPSQWPTRTLSEPRLCSALGPTKSPKCTNPPATVVPSSPWKMPLGFSRWVWWMFPRELTHRRLHDWSLRDVQVYFWSSSRRCVFLHGWLWLDYRRWEVAGAGQSWVRIGQSPKMLEVVPEVSWRACTHIIHRRCRSRCLPGSMFLFARNTVFFGINHQTNWCHLMVNLHNHQSPEQTIPISPDYIHEHRDDQKTQKHMKTNNHYTSSVDHYQST